MIRLRYAMLAVLLLALVPWTLDWLRPLSCAVQRMDCAREGRASVSTGNSGDAAVPSEIVLRDPIGTPRQNDDVALLRPGSPDVGVRAFVVQDAPHATGRDAAAPVTGGVLNFTATLGFGGMVTIRWHMATETGFDYYVLDRKLRSAPDDAFERYIAVQVVDGSEEYSLTDTPAPDTYTYRLRAVASTDQSDNGNTLATADIAVDYVVGLTLGYFALGTASGLVAVNWTAAHEAGVVRFMLDRRLEGTATYDLNVAVGYPQGEGTAYSLFDAPRGTGTFVYRLRAAFTHGADTVLAEGRVTIE